MTSIAIDRTDGLSSATAFKGPVRVATTANINLSGLQTIDGVTVVAGDRVLVKDQTTASENGIWVVDTGNWRRAKDFSRTTDVRKGTMLYVTDGTAAGASGWYVSSSNPVVIGTSDVTFVRASILNAAELDSLVTACEAAQAAAEAAESGAEAARDAALAAVANAFPLTRTAMKGYDTSTITNAYLVESGRQGNFGWDSSDLSATIIGSSIASSAVNDSTETITSTAHGLEDGNAVIVTSAVNGLSTNTLYYVIEVDANNFKLATSHANALAGTAVDLTGTSAVTVKQHFDPEEIVYVCPTTDITGASGAWVRSFAGNAIQVEWAGAQRANTGVDNRRYYDACFVLAQQLNVGTVRARNGEYTFKTACNPIHVGTFLVGGGHTSSYLHGGTKYGRDFSPVSAAAALFTWDGNGTAFHNTGGGFLHGTVVAQNGTSGGAGIKVIATSDSFRPGYFVFDDYAIFGTGTGTFAQPLILDGTACTTPGGQGLRDIYLGFGLLAGATANTLFAANLVNAFFAGTNMFQGSGSVCIARFTGSSAASTDKTTNVMGTLHVAGELNLTYVNSVQLAGRFATITISSDAAGCLIDTSINGATVTNSSTTSRVTTPTREYLPSGQSSSNITRLPGNMILAKGQATLTSSSASYSFGVTFGATPAVVLTVENASAAYAFKTSVSTTGFNAASSVAGPVTADWMAFGPAP